MLKICRLYDFQENFIEQRQPAEKKYYVMTLRYAHDLGPYQICFAYSLGIYVPRLTLQLQVL